MGKSAVEMTDEEYKKFYLDELERLNNQQKPGSGLGSSASQPNLNRILSPGGRSSLANQGANVFGN